MGTKDPFAHPMVITGPEDHLAILQAIDLIGRYTRRGDTFWVALYNGCTIDLKGSEVEIFARGIVYAARSLFPLTHDQKDELARYDVALRNL